MTFTKWLDTFISEKNLDDRVYEINHNGNLHMVESDFVIELAKNASKKEQSFIKTTLVKIDFAHGDVHHFLKHLAGCYVATNF